jgi:hypothetical protein
MTNIHWKQPVDGDFATASDWRGGAVPGASDAAILNVTGPDYTVTSDEAQTVGSLSLRRMRRSPSPAVSSTRSMGPVQAPTPA